MSRAARAFKHAYRKNRRDLQGLFLGGYPEFVLNGRLQGVEAEIPVFAFHAVGPERFRRQLEHLRDNGHQTLETADAFSVWLRGERPAGANRVLLTFDDGLASLYTVAFPLLREFGMHGVSFVVPGFVGQPGFCTWAQLQEMHKAGTVDVQSHTMFHRFAPRWPQVVPCAGGERGLRAEEMARWPSMAEDYRRAREVLSERLGKEVRHLCYPDYDGTDASVAASAAAGYASNFWGVLRGRRTNRIGDDPFHISRLPGEYLACLPGRGRRSGWSIAREQWSSHGGAFARRMLGRAGRNGR